MSALSPYLKFLIQEARTVFEHQLDFKSPQGAQVRLVFDVKTGDFPGGEEAVGSQCRNPVHQRKLQVRFAVPAPTTVCRASTTVPS